MANHTSITTTVVPLPHAYICPQGDLMSCKAYDPSGFVLQSPSGTKTFRTLKGAVEFAVKKGYQVHLSQKVKPTAKDAFLTKVFNETVEEAKVAATKVVPAEA